MDATKLWRTIATGILACAVGTGFAYAKLPQPPMDDAAKAKAHYLRLRRGLEPQPAIQHPADRHADRNDTELPPAGRRGKRGRDVGEIDRLEHAESLPESAFARCRGARVGDARYATRVSTSA